MVETSRAVLHHQSYPVRLTSSGVRTDSDASSLQRNVTTGMTAVITVMRKIAILPPAMWVSSDVLMLSAYHCPIIVMDIVTALTEVMKRIVQLSHAQKISSCALKEHPKGSQSVSLDLSYVTERKIVRTQPMKKPLALLVIVQR